MVMISLKLDNIALELYNGQYRVTAMLNLLEKVRNQTNQDKWVAQPKVSDYHWTINVYISELLNLESAAALSANCEIIYKLNLEGFNAIQIITYFDNIPDSEKAAILKPKDLGNWLNNIFRFYIKHTACMLTVLANNTFHPLFLQYYITQYGKHFFSQIFITKIVASCLNFICPPYSHRLSIRSMRY